MPESPESYGCYLPKVSRDGSKVAYFAYVRGDTTRGRRIDVVNTEDLVAKILCEQDCGMVGDWFPDGSKLLLYGFPGDKRVDSLEVDSGGRIPIIKQSSHIISQPHISPDGCWIALHMDISPVQVRIMVVPLRKGVAASEQKWVTIIDGFGIDRDANWSPDGNLLYFHSERDGFRCIWAQRLESTSKKPLGPAFVVYHSHDPRRCLMNVGLDALCMSVSRNQIVFPLGEVTSNIWITEYRDQQ